MKDSPDSICTDDEIDFRNLMRRVREGSENAVGELVRKYGEHIRRAVRRVLNSKLRSKFDSIDFVQLAWLSFFRLPKHAERIDKPEHLVKYLTAMACNKLRMESRHRQTKKHDVGREILFGAEHEGAIAREPEPVEVAIAQERWNQLIQNQPTHYRQIIKLKLQGDTFAEIGKKLEIDPQTARRFLKRLLHEIPA